MLFLIPEDAVVTITHITYVWLFIMDWVKKKELLQTALFFPFNETLIEAESVKEKYMKFWTVW